MMNFNNFSSGEAEEARMVRDADREDLPPQHRQFEASFHDQNQTMVQTSEPEWKTINEEAVNQVCATIVKGFMIIIWHFLQDEDARIAKRDIETDYGVKTYQGQAKKGEKETFYCNLCKVELNSRETRNSHMQGSIHR